MWIFIFFLACCFVLAVLGAVSGYLSERRLAERETPEKYSSLFSSNLVPDYTITSAEEQEVHVKMQAMLKQSLPSEIEYSSQIGENMLLDTFATLSEPEKIDLASKVLEKLKQYYPEGYFLVTKHVLKTPASQEMFSFFFIHRQPEIDTADFLVHELSHDANTALGLERSFNEIGFWIEDKWVSSTVPNALEFPKGEETLAYIQDPTEIDIKYLQKNNQNIFTTLNELVSYTKSVRTQRAFNYYEQTGIESVNTLSRQLYLFHLQLKNIKEHHPKLWQPLTKNAGFGFVSARIIVIARAEIDAALAEKKWSGLDGSFAGNAKDNLELIDKNSETFDELIRTSGIADLIHKNPTRRELEKIGVRIVPVK